MKKRFLMALAVIMLAVSMPTTTFAGGCMIPEEDYPYFGRNQTGGEEKKTETKTEKKKDEKKDDDSGFWSTLWEKISSYFD